MNVKNSRLLGRHNQLPMVWVSEDGSPLYRLSINRQQSLQAGKKKSNRKTWMCECLEFWGYDGRNYADQHPLWGKQYRSIDSYQNIGWAFCHNLEGGEISTLKRMAANFRKSLFSYYQMQPTRCKVTQFIYFCEMLCMFQAVPPSIIRSLNCKYSIGYFVKLKWHKQSYINHPTTHKIAASRYHITRMHSLPLTIERRQTECKTIQSIARSNHFSEKLITNLKVQMQHQKIHLKQEKDKKKTKNGQSLHTMVLK